MRSRWAILAAVLIISSITAAPALAAVRHVVAQADQGGSETQGEDPDQGTGQSDTKAETGTGEDASEPAVKESGPPWTFQMARIILFLSVLLILAIFRWYWKLVASRARGTA